MQPRFFWLILVCLVFAGCFMIVSPLFAWQTQILDKNAYKNSFVLRIDSNSNPHVAYTQGSGQENQTLMYASWNGSGWDIQKIAPEAYILDLVFDSQNNPHILFTDNGKNISNRGLMYASWTGSNWSVQQVASDGGSGASLVLDASGNPHIVYVGLQDKPDLANFGQPALKYAVLNGSSWSTQIVALADNSSSFCNYPLSFAFGSNGSAYLMFEGYPAHSVRLATKNDSNWRIQTVFENASFCKMILDKNGNPHFTYRIDADNNTVIRYASWNGTGWDSQIAASSVKLEAESPLALDSSSSPIIAFYDEGSFFNQLKLAKWNGFFWRVYFVNTNFDVLGRLCMVLDSNDNPHVCFDGYTSHEQDKQPTDYLVHTTSNLNLSIILQQSGFFLLVGVAIAAIVATVIIVRDRKRKHASKAKQTLS